MTFFETTTQIFKFLGLTRDSLALFFLKWVGVFSAVILQLAPMKEEIVNLGLPVEWVPYIQLVALFVSVSASQHRTSGLAGAPPPEPTKL
jgi:hypothetical protein